MSDDLDEDEAASARAQKARSRIVEACSNWAWISEAQCFVRRSDHQIWNKDQWGSHYAHLMPKGNILLFVMRNQGFVQKYEKLVYEPNLPEEIDATTYNLWRPSGVEPAEGDTRWFTDHIAYLFPDEQDAGYVLDFMALVVAEPFVKIMFAMLIIGAHQGTGKSALGRLMQRMVGTHNTTLPSQDEIKGTMTKWQEGAQLAIIEELMMQGRQELANRLKRDITQPELKIRVMYRNHYSTPNRLNSVSFSNHANAAVIDNTDRRWLIIETKATPREHDYYVALFDHVDDDADVAAVKWLLQHRKVKLVAKGQAPTTAAKREMADQSLKDAERFIIEMFEEGAAPFDFDLLRRNDIVDAVQAQFPGRHDDLLGRTDRLLRERLGATKQTRDTSPIREGEQEGRFWHLWSVRNHERWRKAGPKARLEAYQAHLQHRIATAFDETEEETELGF